jgi:hypothetical protein
MTNDSLDALADDQAAVDRFYWANGPCCAGCDWWNHHNAVVGECTKTAPMAGRERVEMLGFRSCSIRLGAGHAFTRREHYCGDFKDAFDWSALPLFYRKRIGVKDATP